MSEHSTRPSTDGKENGEQSSSEEGSSHSRSETGHKGKSTLWSRIFRLIKPAHGERLREDLTDALMAEGSEIGDAFSADEKAMLNNILRFREVRVEDIMIPRADIDALDQNQTLGEALIQFEASGRSRMPVYDDDLDNACGMVHIRDVLSYVGKQARNKRRAGAGTPAPIEGAKPTRTKRKDFDLARVDLDKTVAESGLVRNILFVPSSMRASELLKSMQAERTQLALVIDEYGGTDGLVSHEDIVEMVVGDIDDEHDLEETTFARVAPGVIEAEARAELVDLAAEIGPDFDISEHQDDVDTLGGLIFFMHGSLPTKGEIVQAVPGFDFEILDADSRRVKRVRIRRTPKHAQGHDAGSRSDGDIASDVRSVRLLEHQQSDDK
jgi:CBS domain containing-hemolysin-like protein